MGLNFGWRAREVRESIWIGDDALGDVPVAAKKAWQEDGDASWLLPCCTKGQPQILTFRTLTSDEVRIVQAYFMSQEGVTIEGFLRAKHIAFRIAVDFPGKETQRTADGNASHSVIVKERGLSMLSLPFVDALDRAYPGMIDFYGQLILDASFATETEKKASSPPSTPTPSSEAASTAATTEASQPAADA